ncbi:hypothetical protein DEE91_01080 [Ralstonia pickettii]|jgi:hypothetical protein|uniref:hypothetical protein n=1 Tax=Ralstonia sp. RRA TaxID=3122075 RepID=UPI0006648BEF|nr:hypothetical protein [Ralstonia insidiosa]MBX3770331.1 hypothetical protein [Ralstonia pickettii]NOZ14855.1 hypothetical protein [Betaproteobacteria bacterium]MBA9868303.1 hypothetical protein [Ralstonia insidiosa]MBA9911458.1 hypothetical protein [Ralstonia insidiosa]
MTSVTINPTPSEQLIKSAAREVVVDDALGRKITLRKPNPLANLDFAKAAGGSELNMLYLAEVAHLKYVSAIDGDPVPTPATEAQLRALYQRLGDEGNEAAQRGVADNFVRQAAPEAELKNS